MEFKAEPHISSWKALDGPLGIHLVSCYVLTITLTQQPDACGMLQHPAVYQHKKYHVRNSALKIYIILFALLFIKYFHSNCKKFPRRCTGVPVFLCVPWELLSDSDKFQLDS